MSGGVEDRVTREAHGSTRVAGGHTAPISHPSPNSHTAPTDQATPINHIAPAGAKIRHGRHHVLIDADEDRWAWRRRIREKPHQLRLYRIGVGFAGLLFICLGLLTGPLPGPGGIPLVLLGLAIWSSEFEWAYRLRQRFKLEIKKYRHWSTRRQVGFWVVFGAVCAGFGYSYLLVLGVPFWMPDAGASLLDHIPGVEASG